MEKMKHRVPFYRQLRGEVTIYWLGASAGAIAADLVFYNMARKLHDVVLMWALAGVICLIVVAAALVQWRFRVLFRPIGWLYEEMMKLQEGDFGAREVHIHGRTDLVEVVHALNQAKANIRSILAQLKQASDQLSESAGALDEGARQTSATSEQNAAAVMDMSTNVEEERSVAERTREAMEETMHSVQHIRELSHLSKQMSEHMVKKAEQGKSEMMETMDRMAEMEREVAELAKRSAELQHWAIQVADTMQAIRSIVEETNLLALNAAIEAARAGEHGKGFAVVAEQVRKLAEQAKSDSERIRDVVEAMGEHAQASVQATESVTGKVARTTSAIRTTGETFLSIAHDLHAQEKHVQDIQAAVETIGEQAANVTDLTRSLVELSRKQTAAIDSIAAASQEQLAMMQEVAASASVINEMAQTMRTVADRFVW
jgi:methyl-accepting chemotaxis protein